MAGNAGSGRQTVVKSLYLGDGELEAHNWRLHAKYRLLAERESRFEGMHLEDAELVVTAFGSAARIAKTAVRLAREAGLKVGLLRPDHPVPLSGGGFSPARRQEAALHRAQCRPDGGGCPPGGGRGMPRSFFTAGPPGAGSLPAPEELLEQIRQPL